MRIRFVALLCVSLLLAACKWDDMTIIKIEELGIKTNIYEVDAEGGDIDIEYFSNLNGSISIGGNVEWLDVSKSSFNGDGTIKASVDRNESFPRLGFIFFDGMDSSRRDSVIIRQKGAIEAVLKLPKNSVTVMNADGGVRVECQTNIAFKDLNIVIKYQNEISSGWIDADKITLTADGYLDIKTDANQTEDVRNATIVISFIDGWNQEVSQELYITQANKYDKLGEIVDFDFIRGIAESSGTVEIKGDYILEGYIVSDKASLNAGDPLRSTTTAIDYSITKKTAYFESLDGKYGFMLECATEEDNIFERYTKVKIFLKKTKVTMYDDPARYSISGIKITNVAEAEKVSPDAIPTKKLHYNELQESDIYTFVELLDVEYPIRQGSLSPVNEGYTYATNVHRINKYPYLVRDINGDSFYMYSNMNCPYRRSGVKMPYGSGSIKGVIVHERCRHYVDEDNDDEDFCGYIGKYQIRHQCLEDIIANMTDGETDECTFSNILCEFRWLKPNGDGTWDATYGKGTMTHSYDGFNDDTYGARASGAYCFKYLGPIGSAAGPFGLHSGNVNGCGIILPGGTRFDGVADTEFINSDINSGSHANDGKGWVYPSSMLAWENRYWWDDENNRPHYWLISFSTENITAEHLSMQLSVMNNNYSGAPRFWKVEWSTIGSDPNWTSPQWKYAGSYSVPDSANWGNTLYCQFSAFKMIDIALPLEMLGQSEVFLRLIPEYDIASDGASYKDGEIAKSGRTASSCMDYFAIRYN